MTVAVRYGTMNRAGLPQRHHRTEQKRMPHATLSDTRPIVVLPVLISLIVTLCMPRCCFAGKPSTFYLHDGSERKAYFAGMHSDTVYVEVDTPNGKQQRRFPKSVFSRIVVSGHGDIDLSKTDIEDPAGVATLRVRSSTIPAEVTLGDAEVGTTPFTGTDLAPGTFRLRIAGPGIEPIEESITLVAGETLERTFAPQRTQAWKDSLAQARSDSLAAVEQARRDSLREIARMRENEAFRPENLQADLDALFAQLVPTESAGKRTVAVLPFTVKGEGIEPEAAAMAAEYGVVFFSQRGDFTVVERERFEQMMQEVALSQTGVISEDQVLKAGKALSAQLLVTGSVSRAMGQRLIAARLIDTQTGEVLAAAAASMTERDMKGFLRDALGERLTASSSMFRSIAVPGWGQYYSGHPGHGTVALLGVLGAAGAVVWSAIDYQDKDDVVTLFKDHDASTVVTGETGDEWAARANDAVTEKNSAAVRTNALIGAVAGVWVLNAIDALICGRIEARKTRARYFSVSAETGRGLDGDAGGLTLNVHLRTKRHRR
ncbi:MAG: PEGA domain-containing protein [Chitinivibrionales bacterium]|nr:PEGA domain-containing protein [Chitinivibrionales bacterium]